MLAGPVARSRALAERAKITAPSSVSYTSTGAGRSAERSIGVRSRPAAKRHTSVSRATLLVRDGARSPRSARHPPPAACASGMTPAGGSHAKTSRAATGALVAARSSWKWKAIASVSARRSSPAMRP